MDKLAVNYEVKQEGDQFILLLNGAPFATFKDREKAEEIAKNMNGVDHFIYPRS